MLESTATHKQKMAEMSKKPGKVLRKDGNPEGAFKNAAKVIERTYTAPYFAHNAMEPVNCFAHVTADKADIYGPDQAPNLLCKPLQRDWDCQKKRSRFDWRGWVVGSAKGHTGIIWLKLQLYHKS